MEETTQIILTFSISNPEEMGIKVENDYSSLSLEMCLKNKKALHNLLDEALEGIEGKLILQQAKK